MRILFCSQTTLTRELGASKVILELSEEMEQLGWKCELMQPSDLVPSGSRDVNIDYPDSLRRFLHHHAANYDVIEYDHQYLPYPRSEFDEGPLFVARSVLLGHHFERIKIPSARSLKARIGSLVRRRREVARRITVKRLVGATLSGADLINVANDDDRTELIRCGLAREKIEVIPNGISRSLRRLFNQVPTAPPAQPRVAFIGTFDSRKGAPDFPAIVREVCAAVSGTKFRLLGTGRTERDVLASFHRTLRDRIEVVPRYAPEELPELLAPCSVGVFPSYIEGFGLGVLEMLAASIPVIAYNSPGPPMMLPAAYLVPRGDTHALSLRVIGLLKNEETLSAARFSARERSQAFCWQRIARLTSDVYTRHWLHKQREPVTASTALWPA